jgi:hypothetical protein
VLFRSRRAFNALEDFTEEVALGWTKELFAQYTMYQDIREISDKLRARLGLAPAGHDLPSPTKVKDFEALPLRRSRRLLAADEDPSRRPDKNPLADGRLATLNRQLGTCSRKLATGKFTDWQPDELREARRLWQWLHYLVAGGAERFQAEYAECAAWPRSLAEEYLKYLTAAYEGLKTIF